MIKKCIECKSKEFIVSESDSYKAEVDSKTGILECYKHLEGGFDFVECAKCGERYSIDEFKSIEINF